MRRTGRAAGDPGVVLAIVAATATGGWRRIYTTGACPSTTSGVGRHAGRQPAGDPLPQVCPHHRFATRLPGLSEPGGAHDSDRRQPTVVADITYIRLRTEFVYLAVVIDRFSRKRWAGLWIARWRPADRSGARSSMPGAAAAGPGPITPTRESSTPAPTMWSCSKQGHGSQHEPPGQSYDNAVCESSMKTLKQEEIYCNRYRDFEDLSAHLEEFIDHYYKPPTTPLAWVPNTGGVRARHAGAPAARESWAATLSSSRLESGGSATS